MVLCMVTVLSMVQISAAADTSLQPTIVDIAAKDCRVYSQSGSDINSLAYSAMQKPSSTTAAGITQTAVSNGTTITIKTDDNKDAELRFVVFSTKLWVPAHTKYSVAHWFTIGGTRTVSNKNATAASSFQLVHLGTSYDLSGATFTPATSATKSGQIAGLSTGTQIAQAYTVGAGTSGTTSTIIGDKESGTTYQNCTYENTSGTGAYISQYFGLWLATQYGSKYSNYAEVTCTLTTRPATTTAEVTLRKDDQPWTGKELAVGKPSSNLYYLTENTPGVYTYDKTNLYMDGSVYYLWFGEGNAINNSGVTLVYPNDTGTGSFKKTVDFYTVTYDKGDATSGKAPAEATVLKNTTYSVTSSRPLSKTGYSQTGWSKTLNGTAVKNITIREPVTLYPVWTARTYTVNFDINYQGGTNPDSKTVTYDSTYGTLPAPTRSNYVFMGWYTEEDGGTRVTEDTVVNATADHTLYAHWAVPAQAPTISNITEDQTIVYGEDPHFSLGYGSNVLHKVSKKWYECNQNGNNARLLTDEANDFGPLRPTVGVHYYYVELTATRKDNGLSASAKSQVVKVTVEKATPTITTKPKAAAIDLADNQTLSGSTLTGGAAKNYNSSPSLDVDGTFTWANGTIKPAVGSQKYAVLFTPKDKDNYNTAECEVSLTVTCSHVWDNGAVTTEPTCTRKGVKTFTCTACNDTKTESINAKGHDWDANFTVDTPATCTAAGSQSKHCSRCDAKTDVTAIPATGHTWGAWSSTGNDTHTRKCTNANCTKTETDSCSGGTATCTNKAVCDTCKTAYGAVDAGNHSWGDWTETKAATCTEKGTETRTCTYNSEHKESRSTAMIAHTPAAAVKENEKAATCEGNGSYDEVTYCTVCQTEISREAKTINALGHNWDANFTVDQAATCTAAGSQSKHCSRCDAVTEVTAIPATGHTWDNGNVTTEPTCTKKGVKTFTCTVCKTTKTADIDAKGHTSGTAVTENVVKATCTKNGSYDEVIYCTVCDAEISRESKTTNALGHDLTHHDAKAATCTEKGHEAYDTCSRCDYTTYKETPALDHDWGEWSVITPATETAEGSEQRVCKRDSSHTETQKIPQLAHTHKYTREDTDEKYLDSAATCTEAATYYYSCACSDKGTETFSYGKALGHDYTVSRNNGTAATCTVNGKESDMQCSRCNDVKTGATIKAKGHTEVVDPAVDATCTAQGKTAGSHCSTCQQVIKAQEPTNALGHDHSVSLNNGTAATCTVNGKESDMKCSRCDDVKIGATIKALGHDTVHHNAKAATCTEKGWQAYDTCSRCDYTTYKETPATGHTSGAAVKESVVDATCLESGSYEEVTYCTTCKTELSREKKTIAALGHDIVHHEPKTPTCTAIGWDAYDTCSRCDYTTYHELSMLGHDYSEEWSKDKSGHWHECSRCADRKDVSGHIPGPEATDTAEQVCKECGYVIEAARGHELVHHEAKAPTCTEIGWDAYDTCKRCDYTTYVEIKATGHTEEPIPAVPATCTDDGLTAGKRCSVCKAVLEEPQTVDALGHDPIHHEAQAATCTSIGWNAYDTCKRCSYTTYQELQALGHDTVHHEAKEATCLAIGWKAYDTCKRCDYTTYQEQPALGHDWTDATCTTPRTCARCAITEGAALGHDWGNWVVTTPATELAEGVETQTCRHDASHTQTRAIPKLPARTYDITGEVRTSADAPFEGVTVTLMLGNRQLASTVTGSDGRYGFNNIAPGDYNLVATKDGVTMTVKVTVRNRNVTVETITMPAGKTNSIVEVKSDDPQEAVEAVVGNLEKLFTDPAADEVYTDADKEIVEKGGSVDIKLTLTKTDGEQTSDQISESLADGDFPGLRLELEISKIVTPSGEASEITEVNDTGMLLETLVHLPEALQGKGGYTVYRLHDGAVETLTTTPNENGEYIEISADKTSITIHARLYSEYVIAYQEAPVQPDEPQPDPAKPERPDGGHTNRRFPAGGTANTATDTAADKTVKSSDTGDMGVALYAVTALLSITGMAWTGRKRGR